MIKSLDSKNAGYTADADMQKWPRSVEKVLAGYKDAKIVVPANTELVNVIGELAGGIIPLKKEK